MRERRTPGGSRHRHLILSFLAALALWALIPASAHAQVTVSPDSVVAVEVVGNVSVDDDLIRRAFGMSSGARYSMDAVRRGIRRLHGLGFFNDIAVEGAVEGTAIRLTIRVSENPRVASVEYSGNDQMKDKKLNKALGTLTGRMADDRLLAQVERRTAAIYTEKGYTRVRVRPRYLPGDADSRRILLVEIEEGPLVRVEKIRFVGTRQLEQDDLKDAMDQGTTGFLKGGVLRPRVVEEDMERVEAEMAKRGFRDGTVQGYEILPGSKEDKVVIEVQVVEGPRYTVGGVKWEGNVALPAPALYGLTKFSSGSVFNQQKITETIQEAYQTYANFGYIYLSIQPDYSAVDSTVDVTFRVIEGEPSRIRNLIITGNTRTKEKVIRRQLALRPGDLFRANMLQRSQRELAQLGYFKDFSVDTRPVPGDSRDIDLVLGVEERQVGTASAGFGFSSAVGLTGFMELGHSNLFGNGQSLNLRLERGSQRNNAEIGFTEPWFRGTPTTVGFDLFSTNRIIEGSPTLEIKQTGGAFRVGRPLPMPYTRLFATYRLSNQTVLEESGFIVGDSLSFFQTGFEIAQETALTSSLALTLVRNSTNHPIYPTLGSNARLRMNFTGGPMGGDLIFQKYELDLAKYLPTVRAGSFAPILMLRSRFGAVEEAFRTTPINPTEWTVDSDIAPGSTDRDTLDVLGGGDLPVPVPRYTLVFPQESSELFRLGGTTFQALRGYEDFEIIPESNVLTRYDITEAVRDGETEYNVNATRVFYPGGHYMWAFTSELQFPIADPLHGLVFGEFGGTWNRVDDFRWDSLHRSLGFGLRMEVPLLGLIGFDYAYGYDRLDRATGLYTRQAWQPHIQFGRIF